MGIASKRRFIIFTAAFSALAGAVFGQSTVHWSSYKTADGLLQPAYTSVSFTPQGHLVAVGFNATNACELDGYSVSNFSMPRGFFGPVCASPGGQQWAMVSQGLLEFRNGRRVLHPMPEIISELQSNSATSIAQIPFLPVRQGCVIFLLRQRLMEFAADDPDHPATICLLDAAQARIGSFTGMKLSPDGGVWISGAHGVAKAPAPARNLSADTLWQDDVPPQNLGLENLSEPEPDDDGGVTVVAESTVNHEELVATWDESQWIVRPAGQEKFFRAWRGPGRAFWAATSESLFQWDEAHSNWVENDEISVGRIFDVEIEPGGAFWLATSDGLIRCSPALWQKKEQGNPDLPVRCVTADSNNRIYFIADNKMLVLENGAHREFPLPLALQNASGYALFPSLNGPLLVQAGDALFQFEQEDGSFVPFPARDARPAAVLGYLPGGSLGLFLPGANPHFELYDGGQIYPWKDAPVIKDPDSKPDLVFAARNGDLWLGGKQGVFWHHDDKWQQFVIADHASPEGVAGFAETPNGKIWCATLEELWEWNGKNWLLLQTKFNHINSLRQSRDGSIWLASNGGLFRYYKDAWLENNMEDDFPNGPVYAVGEDQRGQVWAATAHGWRVFNPEAAAGAPKTFVRRLAGENGTLNLLLEGQDKWKFAPPSRLRYSYELDQRDWSAFRDISALSFSGLAAGKHYFQVRAIDPAGNLEPIPASLEFTVMIPWFKEIRLWVVLTFGLGIAMFFAAFALNRHRQLRLSHAAVEKKIAERTQELEIATRELLHSQKMNALGTLAAGIAHDFNNILSIIKGSAQIIEDNTDQPGKIRTRVSRIKTVVQQGAEIVDAMLGFSRGSDMLPAACEINAVVADTVKLLGDRFLREVEVTFERGRELPEVFAPREFIQQILLNFIFNAAEAMNGQKQVTLETNAASQLPANIFLVPAASESFVLVSVHDRGSGIPPEIMPRIFEPFFTTKAFSARRGTGLGLSMVYELAKKMNAGLAVQSMAGRGSTFMLILPVSKQPDTKTGRDISQ